MANKDIALVRRVMTSLRSREAESWCQACNKAVFSTKGLFVLEIAPWKLVKPTGANTAVEVSVEIDFEARATRQ